MPSNRLGRWQKHYLFIIIFPALVCARSQYTLPQWTLSCSPVTQKRTFSQVPIYLKAAEKNMWDPSLPKRPFGIIIGQKESLPLKRRNSILTFCIFPHTRLQKKNSFVVTPFSHDLGRPARKGIDQTWALPPVIFQILHICQGKIRVVSSYDES